MCQIKLKNYIILKNDTDNKIRWQGYSRNYKYIPGTQVKQKSMSVLRKGIEEFKKGQKIRESMKTHMPMLVDIAIGMIQN